MKRVNRYIADDGAIFDDIDKCRDYESMLSRINVVMSRLPDKPSGDGCRFENGHGFLQHEEATFIEARNEVLDIAVEYIGGATAKKWAEGTKGGKTHMSFCGRLFDDSGVKPINSAWYRLSCIDTKFREWGQMYYALNPEKGEMICLNTQ